MKKTIQDKILDAHVDAVDLPAIPSANSHCLSVTGYGWAYAQDADQEYGWRGPFETRDEAITQGLWDYEGDFVIAKCRPATESDELPEDWLFVVDGDVEVISHNGRDHSRR